MARISGATVLLILVATVSVYTCAILAGAALGQTLYRPVRTMTSQPPARDFALRVSVSLRGLAEDFVKELWGGNHRQGRSGGGARPGPGYRVVAALPSSAARASVRHTRAESEYQQRPHKRFTQAEVEDFQRLHMLARTEAARREISRRDGVHEGGGAAATAMPVSSDTELWGGYHSEEGRSGGRAHAGAGDRAAASLPSFAAIASLPLTQADIEYRERQRRDGAASLAAADRQISMRHTEAMRREMSTHGSFSGEITDETRPVSGGVVKVGPWGGSGGQAFYMHGGAAAASAPHLLSVTLYHADAVHAFSFEYLLGGVGVSRTMGPSGGRSHGSKGVRATINFSTDEHLTAVEGTFGHCRSVPEVVVTSLTFRTNKGRTYGPYGEETGTPFSIPAANGCIVGFWGRSGWLLDAIGVYIMPCQVNEAAFFVSNAYKATS